MPRWSEWQPIRHQVAIGGTVTDATGARVPHATVVVDAPFAPKSKRKAAVRQAAGTAEEAREPIDRTESRADGSFFFLDLPDGTYTVKASHARFGAAEQKAVVTRDKNDRIAMAGAVLKLVKE